PRCASSGAGPTGASGTTGPVTTSAPRTRTSTGSWRSGIAWTRTACSRTRTSNGSWARSGYHRPRMGVLPPDVEEILNAALFWERVIIEITPRRALLWEGGRTDAPPEVFEVSRV